MFDFEEQKPPRTHLEGNMIPVINMTFLLLLFFIVVGNFAENINQSIKPPRSLSESLREPTVEELQLTRDGSLLWLGDVTTVPAWARSYTDDGLPVPQKIRLLADARTPAAVLLPILEDLKQLQVSRVALVTVNEGNVF